MKKEQGRYSEERLNLFVDNELDAEEAREIFESMERDPALKQAVCELTTLKRLVGHAYNNVEARPAARIKAAPYQGYRWLSRTAAALLLVALGAGAGWLGRGWSGDGFAQPALDGFAKGEIIHLESNEPEKLAATLDTLESKLSVPYGKGGAPLPVELVLNAGGLDLVLQEKSPFTGRLAGLIESHPHLTLIACSRGLANRERKDDEHLAVLPGVEVGPTALDRIVMRLEEGWRYQKI